MSAITLIGDYSYNDSFSKELNNAGKDFGRTVPARAIQSSEHHGAWRGLSGYRH